MEYIEIENGVDIVGDIHACFDEWMEMLSRLGYQKNGQGYYVHPEGRKIISLGDVMSRGRSRLKQCNFS